MADGLTNYFEGMAAAPLWLWAIIIAIVLVIWFVPTFIAVFRNRPFLGAIALLNVPGGLSWIVWTALIVWAASGRGPPANLKTNAGQSALWIGLGALVLAAALIWYFATRGPA